MVDRTLGVAGAALVALVSTAALATPSAADSDGFDNCVALFVTGKSKDVSYEVDVRRRWDFCYTITATITVSIWNKSRNEDLILRKETGRDLTVTGRYLYPHGKAELVAKFSFVGDQGTVITHRASVTIHD